MYEWDTMATAYEGCGTSLRDARRSEGYRRLLKRNGGNRTATSLDHLGLTLMREGRQCLPKGLAEEAEQWTSLSADMQEATLHRLMTKLCDVPAGRANAPTTLQAPMLPLEMGPWESERPLPACLGTAIIMAAFALLTTNQMLIASVQRASAYPVAQGLKALLEEAVRGITEILPSTTTSDSLVEFLTKKRNQANQSVARTLQTVVFHGALLIRLRDSRWACLDPYLQNISVLSPMRRPVDQILMSLEGRFDATAAMLGKPEWEALAKLEQSLQATLSLIRAAKAGIVLDPALPLREIPEALRQLAAKHGLELPYTDEKQLALATKQGDLTPLDPAAIEAIIAADEQGPGREARRDRLLLGPLYSWTSRAWEAALQGYHYEPHSAMILSHPMRTLGTWTVVNLRQRLNDARAADLLPHLGSDVVLYNVLRHQAREELNPTDIKWLERRLDVFQQARPEFLHPLLLPLLHRQV